MSFWWSLLPTRKVTSPFPYMPRRVPKMFQGHSCVKRSEDDNRRKAELKPLNKEQSGVAQASCSLPVDVSYFLFREQHLKEIGRMTSARRRLAFLCPEHPELKSVLIARTERNLIFTPTSWALVRWSRTISLEDYRRLNRRCNIWMGSGFERSISGQCTWPLFLIFLSLTLSYYGGKASSVCWWWAIIGHTLWRKKSHTWFSIH